MDQLRIQMKHLITFKFDSAVWGTETEGIHIETKAGGVVYLNRCVKVEPKPKKVEKDFCKEVMPVRLGMAKKWC